jgi:hypothetical protein
MVQQYYNHGVMVMKKYNGDNIKMGRCAEMAFRSIQLTITQQHAPTHDPACRVCLPYFPNARNTVITHSCKNTNYRDKYSSTVIQQYI